MDGLIKLSIDASESRGTFSGKVDLITAAIEQQLKALMEGLQMKIAGKLSGNPIKQHTGKLANSVRTPPVTNDGATISASIEAGGASAFYGKFLEDGTGPHDIFPASKKALAFLLPPTEVVPGLWSNGGMAVVKHVHHPGNRAYHFMSQTLEEQRAYIIESIERTVREAAEK